MTSVRRADRASSLRWRLVVHPSRSGAWNMAVDEMLLDGYAASGGSSAPTLRLYGWRPSALSLGRFQAAPTAHDPAFLRLHGIDLVRRPTGGGAVLHEHERTYAVIGRLGEDPFGRSVGEVYRRIAEALVEGLQRLGLEPQAVERSPGRPVPGRPGAAAACFSGLAPHEISVGGRKLVGAAQTRRRGAFLQHGSILLRADPDRLAGAVGAAATPGSFTDVERELGRPANPDGLDRALIAGFEASFGVRMSESDLAPDERALADEIERRKYATRSWTLYGRAAPDAAETVPVG